MLPKDYEGLTDLFAGETVFTSQTSRCSANEKGESALFDLNQ